MKHFFASVTAAVMTLLLLAGRSAETDTRQDTVTKGGGNRDTVTYIMDVLGDDMLAIYENRDTALPAAVSYIFQGNGVRVESPLFGEDDVSAILDAIAQITISGETDISIADSDSSYTFINADGTEAGSVSFNGDFLDCGDKKYEVGGKKALATIDFPAETGRDMLTLDGPDPRMHEFLERCKTEELASIKFAHDGSESEITESGAIREAVAALHSIGLTMYALRGAEPPTAALTATFVMNDGWEYSLTFYDNSVYVYEYPEPLGVWSFYTDGSEHFIEILEGEK